MKNIKQLNNPHDLQVLIETIREPFLILDSSLRVVEANKSFYQTFRVIKKDTKQKLVYELGNGQWNLPALKKLLNDILPKQKFVKDYEVEHEFPTIGTKIMLLNANKVDSSQLILLAFEDISVRKNLEKKLAEISRNLTSKVAEQTAQLSSRIKELEKLNESMVGRELKMVELKREIKELKEKQ
jgi:nitrogen-specific signal transduction histidine kinase